MCPAGLGAFAQNSAAANSGLDQPAIVTGVQFVHDRDGAAIEIDLNRAITPVIQSLDKPPRMGIELANTRSAMPRKRIDLLRENVLTIHTVAHGTNPPSLEILVTFLVPYGYSWAHDGNRLLIRLKPPEDPFVTSERQQDQQRKALSGSTAAITPVSSGIGDVILAGNRLAAGSAITAGSETTVLQLARGGEVRVCPGTTLSLTASRNGEELMMGLSTGSLETHYRLGNTADTLLTPDFRILFAGPGEFDYAISTDSKGSTCVRGLEGNTASAIVSELIGNRVYQVKPGEHTVFHEGNIDSVAHDIPPECGCQAPVPVMRAATESHLVPDTSPGKIALGSEIQAATSLPAAAGEPGDASQISTSATRPLPAPAANEPHIELDAPLVFRGKSGKSPENDIPAEIQLAEALPATSPSRSIVISTPVLPPDSASSRAKRGVLQRVKGFFAALFR